MPHIPSWIPVGSDSDFTIYNLPCGAFKTNGARARLGIAIGKEILDLYAAADAGLFDGICDREVLQAPVLNRLLAAGRSVWKPLRLRIAALLRDDDDGDSALKRLNKSKFFVRKSDVEMVVPMHVGDYVDFYSSLEHASNLGKIFRPQGEALMPNWRYLPIGYNGRSSTIVVDGTRIVRPHGQQKPPGADVPVFGPSTRLDIELEVGFVTGPGNKLGEPIPIAQARDHIFGLVLVNEHYQTSVPNIYAAGDVIGFPALASTSMEQARVGMVHAFDLGYKEQISPLVPLPGSQLVVRLVGR